MSDEKDRETFVGMATAYLDGSLHVYPKDDPSPGNHITAPVYVAFLREGEPVPGEKWLHGATGTEVTILAPPVGKKRLVAVQWTGGNEGHVYLRRIRPNARPIVRDVNAHDDLLAAAREAVSVYDGHCTTCGTPITYSPDDALSNLRAAIAKAEDES